MLYLQIFLAIPIVIMSTQLYLYGASRTGAIRQSTCRGLGIAYTTGGVVSLVFHSAFFAFLGFYLIMLGLLLISRGLDRLDKKIFIDSYAEDSEPPK
jgi:hypothetical protein